MIPLVEWLVVLKYIVCVPFCLDGCKGEPVLVHLCCKRWGIWCDECLVKYIWIKWDNLFSQNLIEVLSDFPRYNFKSSAWLEVDYVKLIKLL